MGTGVWGEQWQGEVVVGTGGYPQNAAAGKAEEGQKGQWVSGQRAGVQDLHRCPRDRASMAQGGVAGA